MNSTTLKYGGAAVAAIIAGVLAGVIPYAGVVLSAAAAAFGVWKFVSVKDLEKALADAEAAIKKL